MKSYVKQYAQFSKCRIDEGYLYKKQNVISPCKFCTHFINVLCS